MPARPVVGTLAALALLCVLGCEGPSRAQVAPGTGLAFHTGKAFRSDGWTRIPWFELTTGEDRLMEGTVGWFDDRNGDGIHQNGEPYEPSHAAEPGVHTRLWRSGELRVPASFRMPTLLARVTLESGAQLERTCPVRLASDPDAQ